MEKVFFLLAALLLTKMVAGVGPGEQEDYETLMENRGRERMEEMRSDGACRNPVNVDAFGAVGDGVADDTQAFESAWNTSCALDNSVFLVPEGKTYLVRPIRFKGPCTEDLIVQISGTIMAPTEPDDWDPRNPRTWLHFSKLSGVTFQGGGIIDGSGSKWWASSCKINKTNPCRGAPTAMTIDSSNGIRVQRLRFQNSQQIHFTVSRSDAVRISELEVESPATSPNTDGIHISESTNVVVETSSIRTGDDCISIVSGSFNIKMKKIECGPGHGISIGSLGKGNSNAAVSTIVLDTAVLTNTTNGVRIKTWQGGSGFAQSIRFENVTMIDVQNPIIIDQFYCDSSKPCQNQTSAVEVSKVIYRNISGTTRTKRAIKLACSDTVPCNNIVLDNVKLQAADGGAAETFCNCAAGFAVGTVEPPADCLKADNTPCDNSQSPGQRLDGRQEPHDEL